VRVDFPIISADSHITEAPNTYTDYIDSKYVDVAPHVVETDDRGDLYVIDGMKRTIPMGLVAAAGQDPDKLNTRAKYADLPRSGYDANYRIADQNRDGVSAEIIYPSVGMVLCNHPDFDYKKAAMDAYNRWIAEYCSVDPQRLIPLGQTPMRAPSVFNFYRPGYVAPGTQAAAAGLVAPEMALAQETTAAGYVNYMRDNVSAGVGASSTVMVNGASVTRRDLQPNFSAELALVDKPADLVEQINTKLTYGAMPDGLKTEIRSAVESITIPALNGTGSNQAAIDTAKRNRVNAAVFLAVVSPEYQVQK